jgi:hypothetical protein
MVFWLQKITLFLAAFLFAAEINLLYFRQPFISHQFFLFSPALFETAKICIILFLSDRKSCRK